MKSNPDKCHLLVSSCEKIKIEIGDFEIENSKCEKLLGVHFDNRLTFDYHISGLCKKASKKINALARVSQYMNLSKREILMNAFFDSEFKYCPLIWMCHGRTNKGKLTGSTKDALELFITINNHYLRSYLKRIALFLFMKEMYKF